MSRIVLVTGASRGIGAATVRLAATQGYDVCVNYRRHGDAARAVAEEVRASGQRAAVVQADVASEADVIRLFETCDRELGRLTALVNNAGILETQMRVEAMDAGRLQRVFAANVWPVHVRARGREAHVDQTRRRRRSHRQRVVRRVEAGIARRVC
jgi:NAD(P)-dependent dehydrogenase (short-subunit alcohol dehydrogenase family)